MAVVGYAHHIMWFVRQCVIVEPAWGLLIT